MKTQRPYTQPGFALVVTISLMVLLSLVAIGMLSLSSIALRSTSQTDAISTARANARLSLMLAIGELQRHAGSDTRVTARADILAEENPPVLGVWRSWEGLNHEPPSSNFAGRPKSLGYDYRTMKDNAYSTGSPEQGRFLAWLTSANSTTATGGSASSSLPTTAPAAGAVALLGPGSIGTAAERENLQIHLTPTLVSSGMQSGATAWWVGGENQKAYIPKPERELRGLQGRKQAVSQAKSHSTVDPSPFGLDSVLEDTAIGTDEAEVNKALTIGQVDLLEPSQSNEPADDRRSREFFHDLSTSAVGLLTNTSTGGWRKDLSLLSESWDSQPTTELPLFRITHDPVEDTKQARATPTQWNLANSLFYPWARQVGSGVPRTLQQATASWSNLIDYTRFYKRSDITTSGGVRGITLDNTKVTALNGGNITNDQYNTHLHKVRVFPVLARAQFVLSHYSESTDVAGQIKYTPKMVMTPVITLWNPYNVEITISSTYYLDLKILPIALSYQIGSEPENTRYNCLLYVDDFTQPTSGDGRPPGDYALQARVGNSGAYRTHYQIAGLNLKPGQTKVYSVDPSVKSDVATSYNTAMVLQPGYSGAGGGHRFHVKVYDATTQTTKVIQNVDDTTISAKLNFDAVYGGSSATSWSTRQAGVGTYLQTSLVPDSSQYPVQRLITTYSKNIANLLHPEITEVFETTLSQVDIGGASPSSPLPFVSVAFGPRIATRFQDSTNEQFFSKGFVQSSPFMIFDALFGGTYSGMRYPLNLGYEFNYNDYREGGMDSKLPNSGPNDTGYIILGDNSGNGVPRAIVADLPSRPLASLGELVNWDLRFDNPIPPFAFNLVGNSDATPLLASDAVVNSTEQSLQENLRHDDSYCANHLLFDDWFFSTITEDPATFGGQVRPQNVVYGQFVEGTTPLTNRAYKPILEDQAFVANNPSAQLYADHVRPVDSWKTIASRLEVEGMFNVNSTSVAAWRALLGHAKNQRVLYYNSGGTIIDNGVKEHPVSRFSVSGEREAGEPIAGAFPEASEVTGYRTLDEDFLDELAEEVVNQVRLRGPFLSLAEFVNRQLSNDETVALAGALQAALNKLTESGAANNPLATLQGISGETDKNPPEGGNAQDQTGYVFEDAAEGYSTYGVPGWTRQADILRPIAPILSARDDTFVIRGYGDARDGSGKVIANAVCEAVVRRTRDYVDPADAADSTTTLTSEANKVFGRRFEIVSFRWLAPDEV